MNKKRTALAIGAHPDDIEFQMAGTLLLLERSGYEIHYMNLASGNCGSARHDAATIRRIRLRESRRAAGILGAQFHKPLCDDLEILYELKTLRRLASIIREVRPSVVLTHPPVDYMEDHTATCRLVVTAVFARGMRNFRTIPVRPAAQYDVTLYHCMPHTLRDPLRQRVLPGAFVNISTVQSVKMEALRAHQSQQGWLDASQKLDSYVQTMEEMARELGRMSKKFRYAEGWRRHSHAGFGEPDDDPLKVLGKDYLINTLYER
ncbi:MAG: PIG-L family deacetylase [Ignavibacteriales bacterium]|nr:PIG-L family deacetylase [Ignavibacteriales bacterium]